MRDFYDVFFTFYFADLQLIGVGLEVISRMYNSLMKFQSHAIHKGSLFYYSRSWCSNLGVDGRLFISNMKINNSLVK